MSINNKTGWKSEFTVAISTLEIKTSLSKKTIERARNNLKTNGLIDWRSRKGKQSAIYILKSVEGILWGNNDAQGVPQPVPQSVSQSVPQPVAITKLNETKPNEKKIVEMREDNNHQLNSEPIKVFLDKFIELRAYGFDASPKDEATAEEILKVVPLDKAIKLLEQRFETYKPKHPRQRINSLEYCVGYILDHYLGKAETKEPKRANQRVAPMPKAMQEEHHPSENKEREAYLKDFLNNLGGGGD